MANLGFAVTGKKKKSPAGPTPQGGSAAKATSPAIDAHGVPVLPVAARGPYDQPPRQAVTPPHTSETPSGIPSKIPSEMGHVGHVGQAGARTAWTPAPHISGYTPQGYVNTLTTPPASPHYVSDTDIMTNLGNLGFGQLPTRLTAPQVGPLTLPTGGRIDLSGATVTPPPQITAPQVTAAQGGFADFDALEKSLYESQYQPVQRELNRQRGMADEQLAARLAQAGIAESGAGVGQRTEQADEFYRKEIAASEDAASKAAAQRYGMEFEQSMRNAELRQQASLSNAGFNLQAQVANANNLLQASISGAQLATQAAIAQGQLDTQAGMAAAHMANEYQFKQAQNYLQTMGLNFEQEQAARQNYLQLLGLQQADLARLDAYQLETLSLFYNTYLKEVALMIDAGRASTGKQDAGSESATTSINF